MAPANVKILGKSNGTYVLLWSQKRTGRLTQISNKEANDLTQVKPNVTSTRSETKSQMVENINKSSGNLSMEIREDNAARLVYMGGGIHPTVEMELTMQWLSR